MTKKIRRINITIPPDWHDAMRDQADAEQLTLSDWLSQCGVAFLPRSVAEKLSDRRGRGKPPKQRTKQ